MRINRLSWQVTKIAILVVGLATFGSMSLAQDSLPKPIPKPIRKPALTPSPLRVMPEKKRTTEQIREMDQVNRLIRMGEYLPAADLLEMLIEKHPGREDLKDRLIRCLEKGKNFDKLLLVLARRLENDPDNYILRREYGHAHLLLANADSADYQFLKAIPLAEPLPEVLYQIASIYQRFGFYKRETTFIDSARAFFNNRSLLASWQGDALAAQQKYAEATDEYLAFMEKDSMSAKTAEGKLIQLIRYPGSADTVMAVLYKKLNSNDGTEVSKGLIRTYADLLIVQDRFDEAFALHRDMDSLNERGGADIVVFVQSCIAYGKYENGITAGSYVLKAYPQAVLAGHTYSLLGEACQAVGRYKEAIGYYQKHRAKFDRPVQVIEDNFKIGTIYKDNLHNYDSAETYLTSAVTSGGKTRFAMGALFGLADLASRRSEFDQADSYYKQILEIEIPAQMGERAEFEMARNLIFRLKFTEADKRFSQLIARYPRGLYVNDAIQYSLILGEIDPGAVGQFDLYAGAEFFKFIGQADSLEHYLLKICRVGLPEVAPSSYLGLAEMYFAQNKIELARSAIDSLKSQFPDSYYYPFAQKIKADMLFADEKTNQAGLDIYLKLLSDYATFPFAAEI